MAKTYDFAGYVTKNNVRCSDGVVIRENAFADQNGATVPLVWQHNHDDPEAVIGHAVLENRKDGVYGYIKLNDSEAGRAAKTIVDAGDVNSMSIWANNLKRAGVGRKDIVHGVIREVSLVLSGANPGAQIEATNVVHGADGEWDEGIIWTDGVVRADDMPDEIEHAATKEEEKKVEDSQTEIPSSESEEAAETKPTKESEDQKMAENTTNTDEKTVKDVIDSMTEEQKNVMYALIGQALEESGDKGTEEKDTEDTEMVKHNAFEDNNGRGYAEDVISHDAMMEVMEDGRRCGSLREAARRHGMENLDYIQHDDTQTYGMTNVDYLFPDYKSLTDKPTFISRDMAWVESLMGSVRKVPFSRIKSLHADITADEARALGYIKGKLKKDEVFALLKRTTDPQTIYKKQRIDRDDVSDITDFDVVAFLKGEMQVMLKEEIARCILVGDGRTAASEDHVSETHVRPIWTDEDLYTIKVAVNSGTDATDDSLAKALIKAAVKAHVDYKGSGNPIMFVSDAQLTNMLLLEDTIGRPLYTDVNALASKLLVSKIVAVPVLANQTRTDSDGNVRTLAAIIVNPRDYTIGSDKRGQTSLFEDFDIDYNQMKYLIETRISGAMTVPYGAIALEIVAAA